MSRRDIIELLDELSSIVDDANHCLDGVIDRQELPAVDRVSERVRVLNKRLDELGSRVTLLSGGRVAYRTDELPLWLIDKIDDGD